MKKSLVSSKHNINVIYVIKMTIYRFFKEEFNNKTEN